MDVQVELEICGNCKKEIPHFNYVMHSAHCARNITLCTTCKEPIPKAQFNDHKTNCKPKIKTPAVNIPATTLEQSPYFMNQKTNQDKKDAARHQRKIERMDRLVDPGYSLGHQTTPSPCPSPKTGLKPCRYCDLELPRSELDEHENYCGARTDRCGLCGELVMFKYKQLHEETNHGFLKLNDEPGPRPTWDSTSPRATTPYGGSPGRSSPNPRFVPYSAFDVYTPPYSFGPSYSSSSPSLSVPTTADGEKLETSREISRRLDLSRDRSTGLPDRFGTTVTTPTYGKTEYIRNLLHDSAGITAPLPRSSSSGAVPRHNKGRAPQPPNRRRNPPTELMIPCEFCQVPIPHAELVDHETICRIALPRLNTRLRRSPSPQGPYGGTPSSPDEDLPCEFCADLIPASQLLRHQATCNV